MLFTPGEGWAVSVHRDIEGVISDWKNRRSADSSVGVLHLGFDRPPSTSFEEIVKAHPGRMLVTGSAKYGLPHGFDSSKVQVGEVDGLPVFLGIRGWGYLVDEDRELARTNIDEEASFSGWLAEFSVAFPNHVETLKEIGIYDESDYQRLEVKLERSLRTILGKFRIRTMVGEDYDICSFARAAPPWLTERPLATIDLSVRATNVFERLGFVKLQDLGSVTLDDLLDTPNFGKKSGRDVLDAFEAALLEGPASEERKIAAAQSGTLLDAVRQSLNDVSERERDVVFRRMGLHGSSETLQQIADTYSLTRERVRQIEKKAVLRMVRIEYWDDLLTLKLDEMLQNRDFPIPVLGIEAIDSWFDGISEHGDALKYILTNICTSDARVIVIDGIEYFSFLTQEKWEDAVREAKGLLASGVGSGWSKQHCKVVVQGLLPERAREFREFLWEHVERLCHFSLDLSGEETLTSYGRGAEQIIQAILVSSDRPLHFTEIAEQASEKIGREIDVRRAHSAAAEVGLLLGRGTFGADRHLPLLPERMDALAESANEIVDSGPAGRQWHTNEILSVLSEQEQLGEEVDKYVLDIALQRSQGLERLGRMVWVSSSDVSARIDLKQAIIALLKDEGGPLHGKEIRRRLVAQRGVNEHFQIPAVDPLIRIAPGLWGLNDRDIALKRQDQTSVIEVVVAILRQKGVGIHSSEIRKLGIPLAEKVSAETLFGLAVTDERLKTDSAQHLYLAEWCSARRESLREAVSNVLGSANSPIGYDSIVRLARERIGRDFPKNAVSACLQSLNAYRDPESGGWVLLDGEQDPDEL